MKSKKTHDDSVEMTFWEHLDELRGKIIRSLVAVAVLSILGFSFKHILFDEIILAPAHSDFITYRVLCSLGKMLSLNSLCFDTVSIKMINISLAGQFTSHMTISIIAGFILAIPYIIWEFWRFVKPGLTETERRKTRGVVFVISLLFFIGVLFSYFIVVPLMVNFLGNYQVSESVINQVALTSYTSSVTTMCLLMGLMFEFPVLMITLTKMGIITPKFMAKYRKHTFIAILIIAGFITPSPDVFSQLVVTIPLYVLYEISLALSRKVYSERITAMNESEDQV